MLIVAKAKCQSADIMLRGLYSRAGTHRDGRHRRIVTNPPSTRTPLSINLQTRTPLHARTTRIFGELSLAPPPTHLCTHALRHWSIRGRPWNLISLIVSLVCPTALSLPFSITWLRNQLGEACSSFVVRLRWSRERGIKMIKVIDFWNF